MVWEHGEMIGTRNMRDDEYVGKYYLTKGPKRPLPSSH